MSNRSFTVLRCFCSACSPRRLPLPPKSSYGSLTGNVTDKTGAAVPNAKVEPSTPTGRQQTRRHRRPRRLPDSGPSGRVYKLTISAPAFATIVESGVQVAENTVRRVDVQLQVANVGQTVTVAADAAVLQTDRADVNHQIIHAGGRRSAAHRHQRHAQLREYLRHRPRFHASGGQQFHRVESHAVDGVLRQRFDHDRQQHEARWRQRRLSLAAADCQLYPFRRRRFNRST